MISVIIPTYNESGNIIPLINHIFDILKKNKLKGEIIVVDDNSPDKTGETVKRKYKNSKSVKTYIRKSERGLATAILLGILKAKGNIIIGIDADFNHPPDLIPTLVRKLRKSDLVVASRFIFGGGMDEKGRYIGTYLFNYFLKHILRFPTMDNMSGYYAIKKRTLLMLNLKEVYKGYGEYHLNLLWHMQQLKMRIIEVPVYYKKRRYGKSKSHLLKLLFLYFSYAVQLRLKNIFRTIV
jgi:dolichol-phosphate mannosyltransferase